MIWIILTMIVTLAWVITIMTMIVTMTMMKLRCGGRDVHAGRLILIGLTTPIILAGHTFNDDDDHA